MDHARSVTLVFAVLTSITLLASAVKTPVVIVPGDGGCQIEAKLDKKTSEHDWCEKKSDWFTLWLNAELIIPGVTECFVDNMKLVPTQESSSVVDFLYPAGISIRVPDWGYTTAFETLDPSLPIQPYFKNMVNAFLEQGFQENVSLRGVPYDWRLTPYNLSQLHQHMKDLIEDTYTINNNSPAVLVSHSMGGLIVLSFLQNQTSEWKEKFVRAFIPISGPWAGSAKAVRSVLSGNREGVPLVTDLEIRPAQRTFASNGWLVPNPLAIHNISVFVTTAEKKYSLFDMDEIFADAGYSLMSAIWRSTNISSIWSCEPPGVQTYCIYSKDVKTEQAYVYKKGDFPDGKPEIVYGQGDGTVNYESLYRCHQWSATQQQSVTVTEFSGIDHFDMTQNADVIKRVLEIVASL